VPPNSARHVGSLTFPPTPACVGAARRFLRSRLADAGLTEELVEVAALLTSELVTNAVLHANTDIEIRLYAGEGARVEVADGSRRLPEHRWHIADSITGRGLELVDSLATAHGVLTVPDDGKVVWFTVGSIAELAASADVAATPGGTTAPLLGLPVASYRRMRDHNESLLREYALYALEHPGATLFRSDEVSRADLARVRFATAIAAQLAQLPEADPPETVDVVLVLSVEDVIGLRALRTVVADAERVAAEGGLLSDPPPDELRALRDWAIDQSLAPDEGRPSVPWPLGD
jgi:hypothetical protein